MWIVRSWRSCLAPGCCDSSRHWTWRHSTLPRGVGESGQQRDSNGQTRTTQLTIGLQQLLLSDTYLPGTLDEIPIAPRNLGLSDPLAGALVLAHSLRDAGTTKKLAVLVTLDSVSAEVITQLKVCLFSAEKSCL